MTGGSNISALKTALAAAEARAANAEAEIAFLKLTIEKLRREMYGWRSERKQRLLYHQILVRNAGLRPWWTPNRCPIPIAQPRLITLIREGGPPRRFTERQRGVQVEGSLPILPEGPLTGDDGLTCGECRRSCSRSLPSYGVQLLRQRGIISRPLESTTQT